MKQGFFNQLNEAFAYRHLVNRRFSHVEMVPEGRQTAPDIRYVDGSQVMHCEVKTLSISDDEIDRRASKSSHSNVYAELSEGFLRKMGEAVAGAEQQIRSAGSGGLVYLVVNFDDIAQDYYKHSYRPQVRSFLLHNAPTSDVYVKVGTRFGRRISYRAGHS